MRCLVTGGAGFIGSHVADSLIGSGHQVTALDNVSTGSRDNVAHLLDNPAFSLVEGTIMDAALVERLAADHDVVIHLAAAVGVKLIVERPLESLLTNIRGTENVLEAAARYGRRTLLTSTSEIYGKNARGPVSEDADRILGSPFVARWSYSTSKAVDEILAHAYWEDRGLETIVVRLFNCVGPRQTGDFGMVVPDLRPSGAPRRPAHRPRRRPAAAQLLPRPRHRRRAPDADRHARRRRRRLQRRRTQRDHDGAAGQGDHRANRLESEVRFIPYDEAYGSGFEDMERRVPDITRIRRLTGWSPTRSLDDILTDVIAHERQRVEASA